LTDNHWGFASW